MAAALDLLQTNQRRGPRTSETTREETDRVEPKRPCLWCFYRSEILLEVCGPGADASRGGELEFKMKSFTEESLITCLPDVHIFL